MKSNRFIGLSVAIVLAAATGHVLAHVFSWTGSAGNGLWVTPGNWNLDVCETQPCPPPNPEYPNDASDDADISGSTPGQPLQIFIPTVSIDMLHFSRNAATPFWVQLSPASGTSAAVTSDAVRIKNSSQSTDSIIIEVRNGAQIVTSP